MHLQGRGNCGRGKQIGGEEIGPRRFTALCKQTLAFVQETKLRKPRPSKIVMMENLWYFNSEKLN